VWLIKRRAAARRIAAAARIGAARIADNHKSVAKLIAALIGARTIAGARTEELKPAQSAYSCWESPRLAIARRASWEYFSANSWCVCCTRGSVACVASTRSSLSRRE
jgi:hypothetical protein